MITSCEESNWVSHLPIVLLDHSYRYKCHLGNLSVPGVHRDNGKLTSAFYYTLLELQTVFLKDR